MSGGTDPSGVVQAPFSMSGPPSSFFGSRLEDFGEWGDEGTKKRETDLFGVASRLRSEEVRSSEFTSGA